MNIQSCTINGAGLERVRYFSRQLITADDMLAEQQYFRQKLRRHNRYLHGWGVVCGLKVIAAASDKKPWQVKVEPGYALGPFGDEIYVAEPRCHDLADCLELLGNPCEPGAPRKPVLPKDNLLYLAIRYAECETRPQRIHPLGCACDDTLCEYSRIRDDFELGCLPEPPETPESDLLCELLGKPELTPCPPCPESPWVVLAKITLPDELTDKIEDADIDNFVRRRLFSTALLQEQLIACCCRRREAPPEEPPPAVEADLEITKNAQPTPLSIDYALTVTNHGPAAAINVRVTDTLPTSGVGIPTALASDHGSWTVTSGPTLVALLGDLQPGETATLRFTVGADNGTHVNTASVASDTADPNPANNNATTSTGVFNP